MPTECAPRTTNMAVVKKLESLPTELQLTILNNMPDIGTLSALVHSSAIFHRVYSTNRSGVLTKVTLSVLREKLRKQENGAPKPTTFWEIIVPGKKVNPNLQPAIRSLCAQGHSGTEDSIRLTVEECIALLDITNFYRYHLEQREAGGWSMSCSAAYPGPAGWSMREDTQIHIFHPSIASDGTSWSWIERWVISRSEVLDAVLRA